MTIEEFRRLSEAWGGDIERWPEGVRAAARDLAASDLGAGILCEARGLDVFMSAVPTVDQVRALDVAQRVTQQIARASIERGAPDLAARLAGWLVPSVSLAGAATAGVMLALALPNVGPPASDETVVLSMVLDSGSMAAGWVLR